MTTHAGQWIGIYTYGPSYGRPLEGTSAAFTLQLAEADGRIWGTCTDTEEVLDAPASVRGFFAGDFISFVKEYPCRTVYDEDYRIVADEAARAPEIHYTGLLSGGMYRGQWEMEVRGRDEAGRTAYYTFEGTWSMERV